MVEKLWLARHQYDDQRRLIIPKLEHPDGEQFKNILQMEIWFIVIGGYTI